MLDVTVGKRHRARQRPAAAAAVREYAALGWPCCPGAHAMTDGTRACSCDRVGCPSPAAHPTSPVWRRQATVNTETLERWWSRTPQANIVLPTGIVFDVFDVPVMAGVRALAALSRPSGPVAALGDERYLFFVATRGAPADEDEWWSSSLDCVPETLDEMPGIRWHCRDSFVLAPPSVLPAGQQLTWVRPPGDVPLPDPVRVLETLADCCE